jgi:transposase-like protein
VKRKEKQMHEATGITGSPPLPEAIPLNGKPESRLQRPDPEVVPMQRRKHTVAYKIKVVGTIARLRAEGASGSIGAYLRQEGLYSSAVTSWERSLRNGTLTTAHPGPKEKNRSELQEEIKRLRRKLEQTEKKLAKTQLVVELQKKLSAILENDPEENWSSNAGK